MDTYPDFKADPDEPIRPPIATTPWREDYGEDNVAGSALLGYGPEARRKIFAEMLPRQQLIEAEAFLSAPKPPLNLMKDESVTRPTMQERQQITAQLAAYVLTS